MEFFSYTALKNAMSRMLSPSEMSQLAHQQKAKALPSYVTPISVEHIATLINRYIMLGTCMSAIPNKENLICLLNAVLYNPTVVLLLLFAHLPSSPWTAQKLEFYGNVENIHVKFLLIRNCCYGAIVHGDLGYLTLDLMFRALAMRAGITSKDRENHVCAACFKNSRV